MTGTIVFLGKFIGKQFVESLSAARAEMAANTAVTSVATAELKVINAKLPFMVETSNRHERELTSLHNAISDHHGRIGKLEGRRRGDS